MGTFEKKKAKEGRGNFKKAIQGIFSIIIGVDVCGCREEKLGGFIGVEIIGVDVGKKSQMDLQGQRERERQRRDGDRD